MQPQCEGGRDELCVSEGTLCCGLTGPNSSGCATRDSMQFSILIAVKLHVAMPVAGSDPPVQHASLPAGQKLRYFVCVRQVVNITCDCERPFTCSGPALTRRSMAYMFMVLFGVFAELATACKSSQQFALVPIVCAPCPIDTVVLLYKSQLLHEIPIKCRAKGQRYGFV